jgi:hypothetical protein
MQEKLRSPPCPSIPRLTVASLLKPPLSSVPVSVRNSNGSPSASVYQPGRYGGSSQPSLGSGQLSPGIFSARSSTSDIDACNNGDVRITSLVYTLSGDFLAKSSGANGSTCSFHILFEP